jgi:hypothetical protein
VRFDSAAEAERAALAARPSVLANPNFQRWFRGSQVVDTEGQPLVVYHGTHARDVFTEFSDEDAPYRGGLLAFFSTSPAFAQGYGKYVYPAYLSCGDLFDFRDAQDATRAVERFYGRGGVRDNEEARRILMSLSRTHPEIDVEDISDRRYSSDDLTDELFLEAVLEGAWPALECDEFVLFLRNRWNCDGIVLLEEDAINYGIFEPTQVKSATANRGTYGGGAPDILANPMRFEARYTPEEADELRRTRAGRSVASLALRGKVVERMANTPHNFVVALKGSVKKPVPRAPDAVTLVFNIDLEDFEGGSDERTRAGIYTAFTYLHKFGDTVPLVPLAYEDRGVRRSPALTPLYNMIKEHLRLLKGDAQYYRRGIHACVNSEMVREGYASNWRQAFSDLFPLCELTPPSRPLLLPISSAGSPKDKVFNDVIVPDFNKRFREFYAAYIPTLYGKRIDL